RKDASAGERDLSDSAGTCRGTFAVCSIGGSIGDSRMAGPADYRADGGPDRHLYGFRRQQGGYLVRCAADAPDLLRTGSSAVHGIPFTSAGGFVDGCCFLGRRGGTAERGDHAIRLERSFQYLEWLDWRNV